MNKHFLLSVLAVLLGTSFVTADPIIKLSGRKDTVLSKESRSNVFAVVDKHLGEKEDSYSNSIAAIANPFTFSKTPVEQGTPAEVRPVITNVVYDDESVLKAVIANFSAQVRGTLSRGGTNYLQLQGGGLLKPGVSFPVSLPQYAGQTFSVKVESISNTQYALRLGEAVLTASIDDKSSGAGAAKFNEQ